MAWTLIKQLIFFFQFPIVNWKKEKCSKNKCKAFLYWVPCVRAGNNLQVLIFPSYQAEAFPCECTVGLLYATNNHYAQSSLLLRIGFLLCHFYCLSLFLWSISNSPLEIVNSVSVMWEKRNLHENRSCCHPVFRSNLCQASPWSKENGATNRFSPGWEQETADLHLYM